jgi:hypothetical protein
MGFYDRAEWFAGRRVVGYRDHLTALPEPVTDPTAVAWRLATEYDQSPEGFAAELDALVGDLGPSVTALVIGEWGSCNTEPPPVALLAERAGDLPNLRALFIGDIIGDECEVSWLQVDDPAPLLAAYPALTHLTVRGSTALSPVVHRELRELVLESGGLPASTVRAVGASDLPALTHLELWLGDPDYGGDATVDDLAGILAGPRLPALTHLGLRDAHDADALAAAVADAPVVARLRHLDLSMGTLGDDGVRSLLAGQPLTHLSTLNLRHHFVSPDLVARLVAELPAVAVDVAEPQAEDDGNRYVAVGE